MPKFPLPISAVATDMPREIRLQLVSICAEPPEGDGWLPEIKHDGHRLAAIVAGDSLKLLSRNGRDRVSCVCALKLRNRRHRPEHHACRRQIHRSRNR